MKKSKDNIVILMTGTVKPNSYATLALKDPYIRRKQYVEAINFYLVNTTFKIVFIENSGVELDNEFLDNDARIRLELLTYTSEPSVPDKGKGAKELEILNYAFNHSVFINNSDSVVKITGRLKVLNIKELASSFISHHTRFSEIFSCNIYKMKKMDARCFFFTKDFFPFLEKNGRAIDLKYSIEMALWDSIFAYIKNKGVYKQLNEPLRIEGVNAGFGTSYEDSHLKAIAKRVRHFLFRPYYYKKIDSIIKDI